MSANEHGHGEHEIGGDHVPHVLPYAAYLGTWGTLMVLTVITVGASYVNFGPANLMIAVVIATLKATVVAAIFMHLAFDHRMHSLILATAALFLAIFIGFTMSDTEGRGHAEAIEAERPNDISNPFLGGSTKQKAMKTMFAPNGVSSAKLTAPGVDPSALAAAPAATTSASANPEPAPSPSAVPSASAAASGTPSAMPSASAAPSASASTKH